MKKIYQTPALITTTVVVGAMLCTSFKIDGTKTADETNGGLTKDAGSDWNNIWDE